LYALEIVVSGYQKPQVRRKKQQSRRKKWPLRRKK
jgi:hypothetical protein